jgi:hypothetical protein
MATEIKCDLALSEMGRPRVGERLLPLMTPPP